MTTNTEQRLQQQCDELMLKVAKLQRDNADLLARHNACHAELVDIMHVLHCVAEAPAPSMEQSPVLRGVCALADRVKKAEKR